MTAHERLHSLPVMKNSKVAAKPASPATLPATAGEPAAGKSTPDEIGSQAAYDLFLPHAQQLPADKVSEYRADPQLAYHNMKRGVANVLTEITRVARELPLADLESVKTLPQLGQGVIFAALQVNRDAGSSGTIEALLGRAHPLRRRLLKSAEALAESNIVPDAEVAAIRVGRGKMDASNDCVALAALFRKYEKKIAGKSAITPEEIAEADEVGSKLQTLLKVKGTPTDNRPPPNVAIAVDIRNRFWTLLEQRHDHLWRIGAWLWGQAVDEHVPPLQSRVVARTAVGTAAPTASVSGEPT